MEKDSRIFVAGHNGLVGSAIVRKLKEKGYENVLCIDHRNLDLKNWKDTAQYFCMENPEYVVFAAAHAGGILEAMNNSTGMLIDNLGLAINVISLSHAVGVKKLLNFGSSCIYPINGTQPYREEQLGEGKTDENWPYAIAKLAGIELCKAYHKQYGCNFMSVIPCNVYGPNDNFDLLKAHVLPALIKKCHQAKINMASYVDVWGSGKPLREFIYSDDLADACVFVMENCDYDDLYDGVINVGTGVQFRISQLGELIKKVTDYEGCLKYDPTLIDGVKSKLLDSNRIYQLWEGPKTTLVEGIEKTYNWYKENLCEL